MKPSAHPASIPFPTDRILVGGEWLASASGQTLMLEDPSEGSDLASIARGDAADIDAAVRAARAAVEGTSAVANHSGKPWGAFSALERGRVLMAISARVLEHTELLARLEVHDVGKPLRQAREIGRAHV